ncbi:MAG TPA: family 20 glycosylhydrolase [bacterium]|nr:family 20 glycosylhydrolase [bacterium]HOL34380.1 family 20 glycosylhydrolase [bacterium]HPP07945.1 family 20 glycosylhydrolase [bacterium]
MKHRANWVSGRPAIENRVVHIDLKGPKIPFDSFKHFIQLLARWGINGVLVEYEHRFPFLPLKYQFPPVDRYTKSQLKELMKIAKDHGIEWIPLFQTFGHLEYLSRLKGTTDMFENPDYIQQLCPLNEKARQYLQNLIEIACEFHPESRYIHVGQDETFQLGFCSQCKKEVEKNGKMSLYLKHASWVWELVIKYRKKPMFWNDMFFSENCFHLLSKLPADVIPVTWQYDDTSDISHDVIVGGMKVSKVDAKHLYKIPIYGKVVARFAKKGDFFEDLPENVKNIIGIDKNTGYPKSFSQLKITAHYNKNFWATCATYNCSDMLFSPDFIRGLFNPVSMVKAVLELGGKGIIASNWARAHSYAPISPPWTLNLYNIAHFACASYTGETNPEDLKEIGKLIAEEIRMPWKYGEFSLDDILWIISADAPGPGNIRKIRQLTEVANLLKMNSCDSVFGRWLLVSIEAQLLYAKLLFLQEEARWWNSTKKEIPGIIKKEMRKRFLQICREITSLEKKAKFYYTQHVGEKKSFNTWWNGLFELDIYLTEKAINFL